MIRRYNISKMKTITGTDVLYQLPNNGNKNYARVQLLNGKYFRKKLH